MIDIIATVSTKCSDEQFLSQLKRCTENDIEFIRFNVSKLSKSEYNNLNERCLVAQKYNSRFRIIFDLPFPFEKPRAFLKNDFVRLKKGESLYFGNIKKKELNYINVNNLSEYYELFGKYITHDGKGQVVVTQVTSDYIEFKCINDFVLLSGKALVGKKLIETPADEKLIDLIQRNRPEQIWLSFVEKPGCENGLPVFSNCQPKIFYKIETLKGVYNIRDIIQKSNAGVIVARGDLSREAGNLLLNCELTIAECARKNSRTLYIATDFLGSMKTSGCPSCSDIIDLELAVQTGCNGIMLNVANLLGNFDEQTALIREISERYNTSVLPRLNMGEIENEYICHNRSICYDKR